MITCLSNYFGLKNVSDYNSPVSGRYINELPGFKTDILDEIRDSEDTIETSWDNIYNRANNLFEQHIMFNMQRFFSRYQLIDSSVTSDLQSSDQLSSSANYVGWLFDVTTWSKNTKLVIEKVNFHLSTAQNGTIYIFDAWTGIELYSKAFTGVLGINQVVLNKEYATYKYNLIYVAYKASEIQPFKMSDFSFSGFTIASRYQVSTSSSVVKANLGIASDVGMSVSFSLKCSVDNFICQRLSIFSEAFLYCLGIEFLKECKYSTSLNRYTLLNMDEINDAIEDMKMEYDKMIENTMKDLNFQEQDICFHCNKKLTSKILLP